MFITSMVLTFWKILGSMLLIFMLMMFMVLLELKSLYNADKVLRSYNRDVVMLRQNGLKSRKLHNAQTSSIGATSYTIANFTSSDILSQASEIYNGTESFPDTQHSKQEVRHIAFVKVHKAASSTVQNILFRFGKKRGLTFVFTQHPNYFSRNAVAHIPLIKPRLRTGYDILCNHGVFNYKVYSSVLPPDSEYIAVVRDPLRVFISAVNYYLQDSQKLRYLVGIPGNKVHNLIRHPERYDKGFFSYTKNVMARDFGFVQSTEPKRISETLKELDAVFKLVLIVEYFEESLVLMKRYFNWKLQDILFISNNVYSNGTSLPELSPADLRLFKMRNSLDYAVYDFFYTRFWKQYLAETNDIQKEVLNFKRILQQVSPFCLNHTSNASDVLQIDESEWNESFTVTLEDCDFMTKDELKFIQILRNDQGSELLRTRLERRVRVRQLG